MILIAGPCAAEQAMHVLAMARVVADIAARHHQPLVFKASFDKANRTSLDSGRGMGLKSTVAAFRAIRERLPAVQVTTDIHEPWQAEVVADVCDVIQIPALLSRQTDLLVAAGQTGRIVSIKKGQFMSPAGMGHACDKARASGAASVWAIERGTTFGYGDLVVDMRSIAAMHQFADCVIFDATHSCQKPGGAGDHSSGDLGPCRSLSMAALAAGADGIFCEVHDDPASAISDAFNQLNPAEFEALLSDCRALHSFMREHGRGISGGIAGAA